MTFTRNIFHKKRTLNRGRKLDMKALLYTLLYTLGVKLVDIYTCIVHMQL